MRSPTELRPASASRPQDHFRVQGRWTPRWPVLDGRVPNLLEVGRECQPPLNRSRQFRAECVRLVRSASVTIRAGRAQGLAVCFLRSRHSPPEGKPSVTSMSWISYFVGRFSFLYLEPVLGVHRGPEVLIIEYRLEDWFQPLQQRLLTYAVVHRWYA